MPEAFRSPPSLAAIERPRCPMCGTRMSLARIVPAPNGNDVLSFECIRCNSKNQRVGLHVVN
jgi:hypothetical protein